MVLKHVMSLKDCPVNIGCNIFLILIRRRIKGRTGKKELSVIGNLLRKRRMRKKKKDKLRTKDIWENDAFLRTD